MKGPRGPHVIVPYTLDANDMRFINPQGFAGSDEFFAYLRDDFDVLYAEGADAPKMMLIGRKPYRMGNSCLEPSSRNALSA